MKQLKGKRGFTLVELAIVLVIIGLILGAVLKGQEMIQNAKKKRLVSDLQSYSAAFYTFYDKYGQLPGDENDMDGTVTPFPPGDTNNGNGDGYINRAEDDNYGAYVWEDLELANIANRKNNPFGGRYFWGARNFGTPAGTAIYSNYVAADNIPREIAREIDQKYDDGVYNTGSIQASSDYAGTASIVDIYWQL
ncbi:MAG: type II secretion system GspH family protein [Candidatus Desulfofervidaceae bacterium]|nr:type II secretion system GspH family protein [Candidatus Desulfofervidaceae bacterium]